MLSICGMHLEQVEESCGPLQTEELHSFELILIWQRSFEFQFSDYFLNIRVDAQMIPDTLWHIKSSSQF